MFVELGIFSNEMVKLTKVFIEFLGAKLYFVLKNVNFFAPFCCTSEILMEKKNFLAGQTEFFFASLFPSSIEFLIIRSHLSQSV